MAFPHFGLAAPFLMFLGAVMFSAYIGGLGPGILATVASVLVADYFLIEPRFEIFDAANIWPDILFVAEGLVICLLTESLRRAKDSARKSMAMRDDVLAIVAHDLRNPVGVIIGAVPLIQEELNEVGHVGELLAIVGRAGTTMNRLINDLLDAAKIEANGLSIQPQPSNIATLAREAAALINPLAGKQRVQVLVEASEADLETEVDPARILQVLSNILGNALKHSPSGAQIDLRVFTEALSIGLAIKDRGPGIPADELPHLFDRYWQGKKPGRGGGAGLGLFIVKGIVEAHGGHLKVESTPGTGSVFTFTLPLRSSNK